MKTTAPEPAEILVIDDDPQALESTTAVLRGAGHIVHPAANRISALRVARRQALDLILCDVNLAGNSGLELTRELRQLPGMQDVPVMFVSRTQLPDIIRRSHDAGAAYYLRKPLDPEVLTELVSKALWLPHLVRAQVTRRDPPAAAVPAPPARLSPRAAAVQGIRLPLA